MLFCEVLSRTPRPFEVKSILFPVKYGIISAGSLVVVIIPIGSFFSRRQGVANGISSLTEAKIINSTNELII